MNAIGRWLFFLGLPFIRRVIKRTQRAYILIECDGKVLVAKSWLGRQNWGLPGGGLKKGETPEQAALRELAHELNISIDQSKLLPAAKGKWATDGLGFTYNIFTCQSAKQLSPQPRHPEIIEAEWLDKTSLNNRNCPVEILTILEV